MTINQSTISGKWLAVDDEGQVLAIGDTEREALAGLAEYLEEQAA
jgi:hypothetical protein